MPTDARAWASAVWVGVWGDAMILQVTAYEAFGSVHVLVQSVEVTETGRTYDLLIQELLEPHSELRDGWDLAWLVAGLIEARSSERAPWHERRP
jgi:hypothetical protein